MSLTHHQSASRCDGLTLVETLIALTILVVFAVSSTVTLSLFNQRAAKIRNVEAARSLMENYVGLALASTTVIPPTTSTATVNGVPVAVCNSIGGTPIPQPISLIVGRNSAADPVVTGDLFWRVQNMGSSFGFNAATDLVQIDFVIRYNYRNQTYFYNLTTFKAN